MLAPRTQLLVAAALLLGAGPAPVHIPPARAARGERDEVVVSCRSTHRRIVHDKRGARLATNLGELEQTRREHVLAVKDGVATRMAITFVHDRARLDHIPSRPSLEGRTVVVARRKGKLSLAPRGKPLPHLVGLVLQRDLARFGLPEPLRAACSTRPLRAGHMVALDPKTLSGVLGPGSTVTRAGLVLVGVKDGAASVVLRLSGTLPAGGPGPSPVDLEVRLVIDLASGRTRETDTVRTVHPSRLDAVSAHAETWRRCKVVRTRVARRRRRK